MAAGDGVKRAPMTLPGSADHGGLASARVRERMVERVRELGVRDARVLEAMRAVPRHLFVDEALASRAYEDTALPIGHGQTISQPYIVARIAELALEGIADPRAARLLEVGTGCGYAAAVMAQLFGDVVSVERLRALHDRARENLRPLRLPNLRLAWIEQLKPGGRIVAPVGGLQQQLIVASKDANGRVQRNVKEAVRFVPLRGGTG